MALTRINNQALPTLDSGKLPSGTVLQVKHSIYTTEIQKTSSATDDTTYSDLGLSVTITPSSSNSKFLISYNVSGFWQCVGDQGLGVIIYRGSTALDSRNGYASDYFYEASGSNNRRHCIVADQVYDSPNTTSSITYTAYGRNWIDLASGEEVRWHYAGSASPSRMTVMEIAG